LIGNGIRGLQEMDSPLPISGGNFPVHEEFSPWDKRREEWKPDFKTGPPSSEILNKESMYPCIHEPYIKSPEACQG
jgi:hypothetical protein